MIRSLILLVSCFCLQLKAAGLQTVSSVDLGRYSGTWYQIARNPLFFEGNCFCSQQKLAPLADGRISVYNSCNEGSISGKLMEISGTATSEDPVSNARFSVDFNLPQKGEYWIIGLDANYRFAVVSDPSLKSLYILSKTPELSQSLIDEAMQMAATQVDTSKLTMTVQQNCSYP